MTKLNVGDAAEFFGVSKEAVHNRIRRGSLETVMEDGVKMVVIADGLHAMKKTPTAKKTSLSSGDKYYQHLEEQNVKLQEKVEKLEGETRTLREQKEQMLIEERIKIEQIYKEKDEQLKNVIQAISSQLLLSSQAKPEQLSHLEAEIEVDEPLYERVSLKKYLKEQGFSEQKQERILKRCKKASKKDERIIRIEKKCYITPTKYDYSDLLV
jgi:hypothetical protein